MLHRMRQGSLHAADEPTCLEVGGHAVLGEVCLELARGQGGVKQVRE